MRTSGWVRTGTGAGDCGVAGYRIASGRCANGVEHGHAVELMIILEVFAQPIVAVRGLRGAATITESHSRPHTPQWPIGCQAVTDFKNLREVAEAAKKPLQGLPPGKTQLAAAAILDLLGDTPMDGSDADLQLRRLIDLIERA